LTNGFDSYRKKYLEHIAEISKKSYKAIQNTYLNKFNYYIRSSSLDRSDPVEVLLRDNNIFLGLTVTHRKEDYVEKFCFGSNEYISNHSQFYLDKLHLIAQFISYFHVQAASIINDQDLSKLAMYKKKFDINSCEPHSSKKFLEYIRSQDVIMEDKHGQSINLSNREAQCMRLIASGKTAKEIAVILDISPRTAEHHINNLKYKTSLRTRSELVGSYMKIHGVF
nr:helix-turn-helix transcriptional regulator [Alphaproteobacteria bacterium]